MLITIFFVILFCFIGFSLIVSAYSYKFEKEANKYTPAKYSYNFQEIKIPTKNKKNLYGWWVPTDNPNNENRPTIILV